MPKPKSLPKAPKKTTPPPINFEEIFEKIQAFIKKNSEEFILISYSEKDNYFILIQKQILTTKTVNNNSPFQPYESETTKVYPIAVVIWVSYGREEPEALKEFKKFNTKIVKLYPFDKFDETIKLTLQK